MKLDDIQIASIAKEQHSPMDVLLKKVGDEPKYMIGSYRVYFTDALQRELSYMNYTGKLDFEQLKKDIENTGFAFSGCLISDGIELLLQRDIARMLNQKYNIRFA